MYEFCFSVERRSLFKLPKRVSEMTPLKSDSDDDNDEDDQSNKYI